MMALDLTGVNPTNIPVNFKNCGKISFSSIKFDRQFTGGQLLKFNMESVNSVKMENLDVRDALQIKTSKVKKIIITNSYFHRISAGSVTVKSAKEVEVINNVF